MSINFIIIIENVQDNVLNFPALFQWYILLFLASQIWNYMLKFLKNRSTGYIVLLRSSQFTLKHLRARAYYEFDRYKPNRSPHCVRYSTTVLDRFTIQTFS